MKSFTATLQRWRAAWQQRTTGLVSAVQLPEAAFLAKFELPTVAAPLATGDLATARCALLTHYQQRTAPGWPAFPCWPSSVAANVYSLEPDALRAAAEAVVNQSFTCLNFPPVTFSGRMNWRHDPTPDPQTRWARELNRHGWLMPLALAYQQDGDERYAAKFVQLLQDWITRNPLPPQKAEYDPVWALMGVGMRCLQWTAAFPLFMNSPAFTEAAKLLFLRSIDDHARFLAMLQSQGNHHLCESLGLAVLGIYFPEFCEAATWREVAFTGLATVLREQVNADGSHYKLSTGYQWQATEEFMAIHALIDGNGYALPTIDLPQTLAKMYHFLAHMMRPDGALPVINDGVQGVPTTLTTALIKAGQRFGRSDLLFVGSRGDFGTPPPVASVAFANAGVYIMRSDWSCDARYLLFDAGPYGAFHGHEDKLSIELCAFRQPFIVDAGSYTDDHTDPWRRYFVGSAGHNTVLVDGLSQVRRWQQEAMTLRIGTKPAATWHSCAEVDYVKACYTDGYGDFHLARTQTTVQVKDVSHTRHIFFLKPDYWVIVDELQARRPHHYQALFHTHPAVVACVGSDNTVFLSTAAKSAYLTCLSADPAVQVQLARGQTDPPQGWYAARHGQKEAATTVIFAREAPTKPQTTYLTTLFYPSITPLARSALAINPLPVSGADGVAYAVTTPLGTDYLLLSDNRAVKSFGPYQTTGQVAMVRTDPQGAVIKQWDSSVS